MRKKYLLFLLLFFMATTVMAQSGERKKHAFGLNLYAGIFNSWNLSYEWGFWRFMSLDTGIGVTPSAHWTTSLLGLNAKLGLRGYPLGAGLSGPCIGVLVNGTAFLSNPDDSGIYMTRKYSVHLGLEIFAGWKWHFLNSFGRPGWFVEPSLGYILPIIGARGYTVDTEEWGSDYIRSQEDIELIGFNLRIIFGYSF